MSDISQLTCPRDVGRPTKTSGTPQRGIRKLILQARHSRSVYCSWIVTVGNTRCTDHFAEKGEKEEYSIEMLSRIIYQQLAIGYKERLLV